jgi:hypothetical protein
MEILRGGTKPCCISLILFNWCCKYRTKEYGEGFEDFKKRGGGRKEELFSTMKQTDDLELASKE